MQRSSHTRGFLLIELLVAVSIFSVVMLIAISSLLSLIEANYKARALKSVTDNLNFAMENISRNIRTGNSYYCATSGTPTVTGFQTQDCNTSDGGTFLSVQAGDGSGRIEYYFNSTTNRLQRRLVSPSGVAGNFIDITAPEVDVYSFRFYVSGTTPGDNSQPFVRLMLRGRVQISDVLTAFNLQTAVTQRLIDI